MLQKLDNAGFPISAVCYGLCGEDDEWEPVAATRLYDELSQKGAYLKLIEVGRKTLSHASPRLESNKRP